jgi:hypothetical protein
MMKIEIYPVEIIRNKAENISKFYKEQEKLYQNALNVVC